MTMHKTEQEWRDLLAAKNAEPVAYAVTRHSCSVLCIVMKNN